MGKSGVFITFEGIDGCGKTTQATMLADDLEAVGREVVRLRDPGSARLSERIRLLLLDPANEDMCDECELLLYEAARAQMVRERIIPALERGAVVLCDRFCDSTLAYQAGGRGIDRKLVEAANEIGSVGVVPDATLLFRLGVDIALSRATQEGADRLEGEGVGFQERVAAAYARIAEEGAPRVRVIDAVGSPEIVRMRVQTALADVLGR
jgi:dTMP kinase